MNDVQLCYMPLLDDAISIEWVSQNELMWLSFITSIEYKEDLI